MLEAIGVEKIDELFSDIPESVKFKGEYQIKKAKSETELTKELTKLAAKNKDTVMHASFWERAYTIITSPSSWTT